MAESIRNMFIATGNLMVGSDKDASFNTAGQLKGWNEFMRSVPYLASWHDWSVKMQHGSFTEEWWTTTWEHKFR